MTGSLTIENLFLIQKERLDLSWIAGQQGKNHPIFPDTNSSIKKMAREDTKKNRGQNKGEGDPLVGYLNLIHPCQIQILGQIELQYLGDMRKISMQDSVIQLFKNSPACIIIADNCEVPTSMKRKSNEQGIPLLSSSLSSTYLVDTLHYYLANLFAETSTMHGVFMEVMTIGVLIAGTPGIGKSELALELITRGHRLIADDAPFFSRIAPDIINGYCPKTLQDFIEVRGLGIINVRKLFGDNAIKKKKTLELIVQLQQMDNKDILKLDRFEGSYRTTSVLDLNIPEITLPVAPGRNLAVMMECAVSNHTLRASGYNSAKIFARRQKNAIEQPSTKN